MFVVCCIIISTFASVAVSARNMYIYNTTTTLTISSTGTATSTGKATGYQGTTTQVTIYVYLQQYKNGSWQTVADWSDNYYSYRGTLTQTYNVTSGYKYRVKAVYYGYGNGGGNDQITTYSSEVNY